MGAELRQDHDGRFRLHSTDSGEKPWLVDWTQGLTPQVLLRRYPKKDAFRRALGEGPGRLVDATLGFGFDAFVAAALGWRVLGCEQVPELWRLARQAHSLLGADWSAVAERLRIQQVDFLTIPCEQVDVVYLDPMYPVLSKSAESRKEVRWLRQLAGPSASVEALLARARLWQPRRIVLKRPREAPVMPERLSHQILGRTTRYDIYR